MKKAVLFSGDIINKYSKKIFGFALSKTQDTFKAEDLSQEIVISIMNAFKEQREITDMDGFIYTICYYTWSRYVRSNKKHWRTNSIYENSDMKPVESIECDYVNKESIYELRRQISYLSNTNRKIITMYYYENLTTKKISEILEIPEGTVCWYLFEARKILKEGTKMVNNNLSFKPEKLIVKHSGLSGKNGEPNSFFNSLINQNIAIVCYGEPLTIEEIGRKIGVAAAYIEDDLNKMVYSNIMTLKGRKYQTNFFIEDGTYEEFKGRFYKENLGELSEKIFNSLKEVLDEIKNIGFIGNDMDENMLLWHMVSYYITFGFNYINENHIKNINSPERKDGGKYWINASKDLTNYSWKDNHIKSWCKKCERHGIKLRGKDTNKFISLQVDTYFGDGWRDFNFPEVEKLLTIAEIMDKDTELTGAEKLIIGNMVEAGYALVENKKPKILVPIFNKEQTFMIHDIFKKCLEKIHARTEFKKVIEKYKKESKKYIPLFISKEEREFIGTSLYPVFAMLAHMVEKGLLREPSKEEKRYMCTIIAEGEVF